MPPLDDRSLGQVEGELHGSAGQLLLEVDLCLGERGVRLPVVGPGGVAHAARRRGDERRAARDGQLQDVERLAPMARPDKLGDGAQ